jgi:hypothetical protein
MKRVLCLINLKTAARGFLCLLSMLLLTVSGAFAPAARLQQLEATWSETLPVGSYPQRMAFDGANIWVTSGGSTSIMKL